VGGALHLLRRVRASARPAAGVDRLRSESGHEDLHLAEVAESEPDRFHGEGWTERRSGELSVRVRDRGGPGTGPQSQLALERDGTRVLMLSRSLTADQLVALASMLVPAPGASVL
jgi:hypothetical protein